MSNWERVWAVVAVCMVVWIVTLITVAIVADKSFEGYYLKGSHIYIQKSWLEDSKACDYTEQRWKYIIENDLHVKRESK